MRRHRAAGSIVGRQVFELALRHDPIVDRVHARSRPRVLDLGTYMIADLGGMRLVGAEGEVGRLCRGAAVSILSLAMNSIPP